MFRSGVQLIPSRLYVGEVEPLILISMTRNRRFILLATDQMTDRGLKRVEKLRISRDNNQDIDHEQAGLGC